MHKRLFIFIIYLFPLLQFSQDFSALWKGHFSYNEIKDVTQGNNKIYAAADNAIFSLDIQTNEIQEITTVNGLSGETISTIHYSETYELLVVGYQNGLIEIVFDNNDDILSIVDIIDKPTIPPTNKKINHFNAYQNYIYISTDYGITVFDLERLEFGDTYFIGNGGSQIQVNQTTIFGDYIYAACLNDNGIKKANISNFNLIDFQNWQLVRSGNWLSIENQEDNLYATGTDRRIYKIENDILNELFQYADAPVDVKSINGNLIVTTKNNVFIYDANFNIISQVFADPSFETQYTASTVDTENIYIGTKDFGILKTSITNPTVLEEIHPDGPLLNIPFSIKAEPNELWVTFGEYNLFYNPYPLNERGFSHLKNGVWINNQYSEVLEAKSLNNIVVNPFNTNQVFISSFFNGLLEVNEEIPTNLYNQTNSGLESMISPSDPNKDIRVGPTVFDKDGLLWTLTGWTNQPLKSYNPSTNQWNAFSFSNISKIPDDFRFANIVIGDDNTKWISSFRNGIIGFNENGGTPLIKSISKESQNIPAEFTTALALDKRNQLWIGTIRGLRVLYNTSNYFTDENVQAEEIIIEENGIAKELLFQQFITDIEVDGSNNKWIATQDSGLFYFSSDGQKTIFHFTKDNSPLPSNSIRDLSLDDTNGTVYIATIKGLVSFRAGGSGTVEDLQSAYIYPNPVRPTFDIVEKQVKIKDLSENVNIKITDIEGNLVAEAQSGTNQRYNGYNLEINGGTAFWNGKNLANNVVASGVYLIMLSDLDTFETKVLKLMVVR
ncbi:ABC transporter substrate-binding protein [Flavivirga aquatica]|uniref:ABC transporter substrate-binding protein n=1 Tax=Flavivirga aquatica TaxID=1849968 RepID=A0A1E5TEE5_9FLAO|nr:ABC transporter substrate-binding protein [Flavivirga aquatica]OEK09729.1 ABC transporter substrate-binding protein [Flavivirga aquatica]